MLCRNPFNVRDNGKNKKECHCYHILYTYLTLSICHRVAHLMTMIYDAHSIRKKKRTMYHWPQCGFNWFGILCTTVKTLNWIGNWVILHIVCYWFWFICNFKVGTNNSFCYCVALVRILFITYGSGDHSFRHCMLWLIFL